MEIDVIDNKAQRATLATRTEVLERVGHLAMVPMRDFATTEQVAGFYSVEERAVRELVAYHKDEFVATGHRVIRGAELRQLKGESEDPTQFKYAAQVATFDRRAILLLGMLLRDSEVAKSVRHYLLSAEAKVHEVVTSSRSEIVPFDSRMLSAVLDANVEISRELSKASVAMTQSMSKILELLESKAVEGPKQVRVMSPTPGQVAKALGVQLFKDGKRWNSGIGRSGRLFFGWFDPEDSTAEPSWYPNWSEAVATYQALSAA